MTAKNKTLNVALLAAIAVRQWITFSLAVTLLITGSRLNPIRALFHKSTAMLTSGK